MKRFLKIYKMFSLLGPKRGQPLYLYNLNPHLPSMFPAMFGWNWPGGSWEEDFLSISLYITREKFKLLGVGPYMILRDFMSTTLNLLVPRMFHSKYQCIPAGGSWEEDLSTFSLFCPKRPQPIYLNKSELHPPGMFPAKFGWNWPGGSKHFPIYYYVKV